MLHSEFEEIDMKNQLAVVVLGIFTGACGGGGAPSFKSIFPDDGAGGGTAPAVGSYVKDTDPQSPQGLQTAAGWAAIEALIDGSAAPFFAANGDGPGKDSTNKVVAMAQEFYVSSDHHQLVAQVWQYKDAASASATYAYLVTNKQFYKDQTWTDLTLKDASRIAETGNAGWYVCVRKGAYYLEVHVLPADAVGRTDAESFASALLSKI